jgi:hypothetical protein
VFSALILTDLTLIFYQVERKVERTLAGALIKRSGKGRSS